MENTQIPNPEPKSLLVHCMNTIAHKMNLNASNCCSLTTQTLYCTVHITDVAKVYELVRKLEERRDKYDTLQKQRRAEHVGLTPTVHTVDVRVGLHRISQWGSNAHLLPILLSSFILFPSTPSLPVPTSPSLSLPQRNFGAL